MAAGSPDAVPGTARKPRAAKLTTKAAPNGAARAGDPPVGELPAPPVKRVRATPKPKSNAPAVEAVEPAPAKRTRGATKTAPPVEAVEPAPAKRTRAASKPAAVEPAAPAVEAAAAAVEPAGPATAGPLIEPVAATDPGRRRPRRALRVVLAAILIGLAVAVGVLGYLAAHNDSVASQYRRLDLAADALNRKLNVQLQTANHNIASLDQEVTGLKGQLGSTQSDLANVASQKEKVTDLLVAAGQVAGDLNSCINQIAQFGNDVQNALNTGSPSASQLQTEAQQLDATCSRAQSANESLQGSISALG